MAITSQEEFERALRLLRESITATDTVHRTELLAKFDELVPAPPPPKVPPTAAELASQAAIDAAIKAALAAHGLT